MVRPLNAHQQAVRGCADGMHPCCNQTAQSASLSGSTDSGFVTVSGLRKLPVMPPKLLCWKQGIDLREASYPIIQLEHFPVGAEPLSEVTWAFRSGGPATSQHQGNASKAKAQTE
jgi:hypothetical protein